MERSRSNQLGWSTNTMERVFLIIRMKYIAVGAEGDCHQHESTKAKVPEGAKNQNNLISDPLSNGTSFVSPLLAITRPTALSCFQRDRNRPPHHQSTSHSYSDSPGDQLKRPLSPSDTETPMVRTRARQLVNSAHFLLALFAVKSVSNPRSTVQIV